MGLDMTTAVSFEVPLCDVYVNGEQVGERVGEEGTIAINVVYPVEEAFRFVLAISQVLQDVSNVWNVLGYCGGFAAGTWVGLVIEEKLAMSYAIVQVISQNDGVEITAALRKAGYGVTEMVGEGLSGRVHVVTTVVRRRDIPDIMSLVSKVDEMAFVTIDDASRVYRGHLRAAQRT